MMESFLDLDNLFILVSHQPVLHFNLPVRFLEDQKESWNSQHTHFYMHLHGHPQKEWHNEVAHFKS